MRLRRGLPALLFVLLLVAVPILEIWVLVQVGRQIGLLPTVAILVAEALLGAWLMQREGSRAWQALTAALTTGRVPSGELADAALVLVGGVLLMLPGFVTDLVGFLFVLPITRPVARRLVAFFVARRIRLAGATMPAGRAPGGATVIRGETVPEPGPGPSPAEGPVIIRGELGDRPGPTRG